MRARKADFDGASLLTLQDAGRLSESHALDAAPVAAQVAPQCVQAGRVPRR